MIKYLKKERNNHDDYYYLRAEDCKCEELKGTDFDECILCSVISSRLAKYLKENEEDFWDERHLRGVDKYGWKRRKKKGYKVRRAKL